MSLVGFATLANLDWPASAGVVTEAIPELKSTGFLQDERFLVKQQMELAFRGLRFGLLPLTMCSFVLSVLTTDSQYA